MRSLLIFTIGFGCVIVLGMSGEAFGPSAIIFGAIAFAIAFAFIVRRYRFSLRTFMLVVTVLSVWLGIKLNRDAKLNEALSSIKTSGGSLSLHDKRPNFPWGLWKHRYRIIYHGLEEPLTGRNFVHLETLAPASIQFLDLSNTGITDADLKSLESHTHLEFLSLANETYISGEVIPDRPQNSISDSGLTRLSQLKALKGIDLSGTAISDEGLKVLSAMPNLIWVYLNGTKVSGSGLNHLRSHKHLIILELNGCKMMPVGYQEIIRLPNLSCLELGNSGVTDADLQLLRENTKLGILRLHYTDVSDEAVRQFQLSHPKCITEH